MKIFLSFFLVLLSSLMVFPSNDSTAIKLQSLDQKIELTNDKIKQIQQGQLTYQIEKDLLKETYSNNYDRINTVITIILGIIGILAYLGIRDINSIKKEYQSELEELKKIKNDFDIKTQNFDSEKGKFESDIKEIVKQNEEQNQKIKVLELKEKVKKLVEEDQVVQAFEYCNIALEINPLDVILWNQKGIIHSRLNQFENSKECFKKALEIDPDRLATISNYVESLYFLNEIDEAKSIIAKHQKYFYEKENGNLIYLFDLIQSYFDDDENTFKEKIADWINFDNPEAKINFFRKWDLKDAMFFAAVQADSEKKKYLQNMLWYWNGKINAATVAKRLGIDLMPDHT